MNIHFERHIKQTIRHNKTFKDEDTFIKNIHANNNDNKKING